jgi:thioredoxin reductase (NADPH)
MVSSPSSIFERRRDQMFPELDPLEIERMRRFGETRNFAQGEVIVTAGQVSSGLVVILSGETDIVGHESFRKSIIVTQGRGQFMGEFAQLAGRPALADAGCRFCDSSPCSEENL